MSWLDGKTVERWNGLTVRSGRENSGILLTSKGVLVIVNFKGATRRNCSIKTVAVPNGVKFCLERKEDEKESCLLDCIGVFHCVSTGNHP
jgi:hypothetical protein